MKRKQTKKHYIDGVAVATETTYIDMDNSLMDKSDIDCLRSIAFYLEGVKAGKGNLEPLGTKSLEALWKSLTILRTEQNIHRQVNMKLYDMLVELRNEFQEEGLESGALIKKCDKVISDYQNKIMF
jgi:hypothetical protein